MRFTEITSEQYLAFSLKLKHSMIVRTIRDYQNNSGGVKIDTIEYKTLESFLEWLLLFPEL